MKMVYICSPYRGDTEKNTKNVKRYCLFTSLERKIPVAPHLYFTQFLDDGSSLERYEGTQMGLELMQYCEEMRIYCTELTEGMIAEIRRARELNLKLRFFTPEMEELNRDNYIIHLELGPGYRRLIAESFGDRFYFEGCAGGCGNCSRSKETGDKSDSGSESRTESGAEEKGSGEGTGSGAGKHSGFFLGIRFRRKHHV